MFSRGAFREEPPGLVRKGVIMPIKETCLDHTLSEVEELTAAVRLLKSEFANQPSPAKIEHSKQLEYVRRRFAEYKKQVEELEEAPEEKAAAIHDSAELIWKDLKGAIDTLLVELA